jgi:hypothetical protein
MKIKIVTVAEIPEELAQKWFQHMRDFDVAHAGCDFKSIAEAPGKTVEELREMLIISPPLREIKTS